MESLTRSQRVSGEEIQAIIRNFSKDSSTRKTTREYFTSRLNRLNTLWEEFEATDGRIRDTPDISLDHEYLTSNYFEQIKTLYGKYKQILSDSLAQIEASNNTKLDVVPKGTEDNQSQPNDALTSTKYRALKEQDKKTSIETLMRRQKALMNSLARLINGKVKEEAPTQCLESMNRLWSQVEEIHHSIWEAVEDPESEGYNMELYTELETSVLKNQASLSKTSSSIQRSEPSNQLPDRPAIQLPKMSIPKFDGDYLKWQTFSDIFTKMIHEQTLPPIQKMWYLKTNVSGDAERLMRHLELTEDNYSIAWNILQDRFSNKRAQTSALIQRILSLPNINPEMKAIREFHDAIHECLAALKTLGIETTSWAPLLTHLLIKKLDRQSHLLYEQSLQNPRELQTMDEFLKFLKNRFESLEAVGGKEKAKAVTTIATSNTENCKICGIKSHPIYYCEKFLKMSAAERLKWTQRQHLCVNCFKADHNAKSCSSRCCTKCSGKHNTLLHLERACSSSPNQRKSNPSTTIVAGATPTKLMSSEVGGSSPLTVATIQQVNNKQGYVLLATARVLITANDGQTCEVRAILDSGSQINLITERLIKRLSLSPTPSSLCIEGIGRRTRNTTQRINIQLHSTMGNFSCRLEAFILPNIVSPQPTENLDTSTWSIPENINLADPNFHRSSKIEVLLGAEFYHQLIRPEQIQIGDKMPILQNTVFGWVVTGKIEDTTYNTATCGIFCEEESTNELIERFWRLDDFENTPKQMTSLEKYCESHFVQNVSRSKTGRFIVRLPFRENGVALGDSMQTAFNRFMSLERRLNKNPKLREDYVKFMDEYESLGHMEEIRQDSIQGPHFFIPHHCVLKPDSSTTKLRVVFDASAKTSSGLSLNDILHTGPTVQSELLSILLRFRLHKYVFTADVEKMYRQILVHEEDQPYQLIMWRRRSSEEIRYYRLKTVTYGTSSAPYLATKSLQYLATQNKITQPIGAQILQDDFYVDDCISGSDSIAHAKEAQSQVSSLLNGAGLKLRKWCANHPSLLKDIPAEDQEVSLDFSDSINCTIKTLGLIWQPKTDQLCGRAQISDTISITKRSVSSDIARIFDPLGLFGPVVVKAKIFMQQLWHLKLSWDDELPQHLKEEWIIFRNNMSTLNQARVPRHIFNQQNPTSIQMHTFVDASEQAYGAAVYLRSTYKDRTIIVRLLCAKSRIAPVKQQTLPRLELCAAVLGAELTSRVREDLRLRDTPIHLWTDSQIVLSWINSTSSSFHTFVANRVAKIQECSLATQWRHVPSKENPADLLSRGISAASFMSCSMWLYGPFFLHGNESTWHQPFVKELEIPSDLERKRKHTVAVALQQNPTNYLIYQIKHRNSFNFLQRIMGYVLRFTNRARKMDINPVEQTALSPKELNESLLVIVKQIQSSEFTNEIQDLKGHRGVCKSSALITLAPFLDERGILRVGGRLEAASISFDAKHPILMPYNEPITKLLFKMKHDEHNHCGPQTLLSILRQQFWPIKGKIMARHTVHKCIRCTKTRPQLMTQVMGNLPVDRVTANRPFLNSGVDFCGPLWVHYKIRGKKPHKVYLAVFCCFTTKAVHLEIVTDLTTEAFIGALRRFINRRGRIQTLYCDNATNFVGARNQLHELNSVLHTPEAKEAIIKASSNKGITFKFIPPRAPHFGGLWEAAVKSAKHLLVKTVSISSLTHEELETVITEVEAILNSRPLTPLSSNPNDLAALTPGHFLIGEPLIAQVDPDTAPEKINLRNRWNSICYLKHEFWKRWSSEYLNQLQQRIKWNQHKKNIKVGDMVIIKEDNTPTLQWPLGRIVEIFKGDDNVVRVVNVKTKSGIFKRPIHRLAPLFEDIDNTDEKDDTDEAQVETSQYESRMNETTETPTKRRRTSCVSLITTVILSLFLLPVVCASPINISRFDNNPGIYFENLGSTNLVANEWKIIVYYDLAPIRSELESFNNGTIALEHLCNQLQLRTTCSALVTHFTNMRSTLQADTNLISKHRTPRAAINIVGNLAHSLFGLLDSDYAEELSKTINQVNTNEAHLLKMLKNQTSIIDSTINIMKQDYLEGKERMITLQNQVTHIIARIGDTTDQFRIFQIFTSLTMQLMLMATNLQQIENAIRNTFTDVHYGTISPLLLSPAQLRAEIINIKNNLPQSQKLPFEQEDLLHFYKISTTKGQATGNHLLFVIKIPLVEQESFNLFQLTPFPSIVNNTLLIISPAMEILAINRHRDQYFAMTASELKECYKGKDMQFFCANRKAKYHAGSQAYNCEFNLFNNNTVPSCSILKPSNDLIWTQLNSRNQWVFGTLHNIQLTAVCKTKTLQIELTGSGILSMENDCILRNNLITIEGNQMMISTLQSSYISFGNISSIAKPKEVHAALESLPTFNNSHIEALNHLQIQLSTLQHQGLPKLNDKVFFNSIHHHLVSYFALLLSMSFGIIIICKLRKKLTSATNSTPVSQPRTQYDVNVI